MTLAALVRPRGVVRSEHERAFVAVAVAAIGAFTWYTAVKAAYISTVFSTLTEERNLIYLSPILFAATALALERPRLRLLPVLAAAALAGYVLVGTNYKMDVHLYNDAPGLAILQSANRNLGLTPHGARIVLLALLAGSVAVLLASRVPCVPVRPLVVGATLFVLAWNVTGQMAAASASRNFSDELLQNYPRPLNWLDEADHGRPAMYLGQQITDANGLWLLEFWNKSLQYVWSLDGTAKGPGPTLSPDLLASDGRITTAPGIQYVVVDPGIDLVGQPEIVGGVRGIIVVELFVKSIAYDAHSSLATVLPSAPARLIQALATFWNEDGQPAVDGLNDGVLPPTPAQVAIVDSTSTADLADRKREFGVDRFLGGMNEREAIRAMTFTPTCNVQGLWAGFTGPGAKTITPAEAHVRIDIRLVPDQDPTAILANLRAHLDRRGFEDVKFGAKAEQERAYWTTPDDPLLDAAARVSEAVFGRPAKRRLSAPGTAPMWQVCGRDTIRMTSLGGGHDDCRAHAPDENYRLDYAAKAAQVTARFLDEFAAIDG